MELLMSKKRFDTEELSIQPETTPQVDKSFIAPSKKVKRLFESNDNFPVSKTIRISKEQSKFLFDETMRASQEAGRVVNEAEIIRAIIDDAMRAGG
jgi:hypothetical protein